MSSLNRKFNIEDEQTLVLVEFRDISTPASPQYLNNCFQRLVDHCGVKILSDQDFEGMIAQPATRSRNPVRKFIEVKWDDERTPLEVTATIEDVFAEEVVTVLPVPPAIPAIAPESVEPANFSYSTPDFHTLQGYSGSAPLGLGFYDVAILEGSDGSGITVIDLEGGWMLDHEALRPVRFNLWSGVPSNLSGWIEHGTAVSSILIAPRDGIGISGLVPGARKAVVSVYTGDPPRQRIAQQIDACRQFLGPGDVLLIEMQRPGPLTNFQPSDSQRGYIPTSFWPDVKESIRACITAGIVVVEVAGNGGIDLGSAELQGAFDQNGSSLTTLGGADSGSIIVGAGRSQQGDQSARSRLDFSNYGARLDCQAWGELVVSAGYGDLWGKEGDRNSYTGRFLGTSSAAPMVAAAVVATQGRYRRKYGKPLPPLMVRQIFASLGSPQTGNNIDERIGPQPDLSQIFAALGLL